MIVLVNDADGTFNGALRIDHDTLDVTTMEFSPDDTILVFITSKDSYLVFMDVATVAITKAV